MLAYTLKSTTSLHPTMLCLALATALLATTAFGETSPFSGSAPRVTNGLSTQSRPTTAALLVSEGINHRQICSATLIGCHTVLTAAHCVCNGYSIRSCGTPKPGVFSVYLPNVGIVKVSAIKVHPEYDFGDRGDIAVLTLAADIDGVTPTPINTGGRVAFGSEVEIVGYGITQGGAADSGLLRRGFAESADCRDVVNPDAHVCWNFVAPMAAPGTDSNTCNGDSGGPLFADLGEGTTVVGVTSGGASPNCLPADLSYDTDVYVHRDFVQGVAGTDLLATSCGDTAPVGDPRTTVATEHFDGFTEDAAACRSTITKMYSAYVSGLQKSMQSCFDAVGAGAADGPCPDSLAAAEIASQTAKVSARKLAAKCPVGVIASIEPLGACVGATSPEDLAACIVEAGDAAVAAALRAEYADDNPTRVIPEAGARSCQQAVASAGAMLLRTAIKARTKCEGMQVDGKVLACPDEKTSASIARAEKKACTTIESACSDEAVETLGDSGEFGESCTGVGDATTLATCQVNEHAAVVNELLGTLKSATPQADFTVEVPEATARLVVTLNGVEAGTNDLDLYVRREGDATTTAYDVKSENGGMFETAVIEAPEAGTWHVHLNRYSGIPPIAFQLTATAYGR